MRGAAYLLLDTKKAVVEFSQWLEICPNEDRANNTLMLAFAMAEDRSFRKARTLLGTISPEDLEEEQSEMLAALKETIRMRKRPSETELFDE